MKPPTTVNVTALLDALNQADKAERDKVQLVDALVACVRRLKSVEESDGIIATDETKAAFELLREMGVTL